MRVTSEFWVTALMRRVLSSGGFAALERRGARDAGAVFLRIRNRGGAETLLAPAPQVAYGEERPGDRLFSIVLESTDGEDVGHRLEREIRFDSDVWIVELEPGNIPVDKLLSITTP